MPRGITTKAKGPFSPLLRVVAIVVCLGEAPAPARAQQPNPLADLDLIPASTQEQPSPTNLLGKCVVPRFGKFVLRDDRGNAIKDGSEFQVYRVKHADKGRLRLEALRAPISGWSIPDEVVVVEEPGEPAPAPAPPAPLTGSAALRAWAEMPDQIFPTRDDPHNPGGLWEGGSGLEPREVADSFKAMFSGKSDIAYELMIKDLSEVIRAHPDSASSYYLRGVAWKQRKQYDKALSDFSDAIQINPRDPQCYCARGMIWAEKKRYDQAIHDFTEAIKIDGLRADAYFFRGYAYYFKKQYDKSVADLTEVIRLMPGSAVAHGVRGWAWEKLEKLDNALADYTEAITRDPRNPGAYVQRGAAWGTKKEYDNAIADFDEALRIDPANPEAYYFRGMSWCAKDQLDKALADLDHAIDLDPKLMGAHATRARIWYAKKEYSKAVSDFDRAIRRQPQLAILYVSRAMAWHRQHVYDKATADYAEAIQIEPANSMFLNDLAWFLATCPDPTYRNGKKAVELATKACALLDWKQPGEIDTLAAAYAEASDFAAAVKWQTTALEQLHDQKEKDDYRKRLELYKSRKTYQDMTP